MKNNNIKTMKKKILIALSIFSLGIGISAQTYTEITGTPFAGSTNPEMAFFDKDGDGDLDVVISSYYQTDYDVHADLYENDGNGNFTIVTSPFLGCHSGDIGVGDIDGDGDIDIIINGKSLTASLTTVYINDGAGNFTIKTNTGIMGLFGSLELEDMDGDGDLDLIVSGSSQPNYPYNQLTYSYENDGAGNFTATQIFPSNLLLTGIQVFDIDNDGDNDVLTSTPYNGKQLLFYENLNNSSYAPVDTLMTGVAGSLTLINVNGNNFTDIIIGGSVPGVYTNNGNKTFTQITANSFGTYSSQRYCVADFNGDGTEDFVVVGWRTNPSVKSSELYYNNGGGVFTQHTNPGFTPIRNGGVIAGDVNGNGDLEILILGMPSGGTGVEVHSLYQNPICVVAVPDANFKAYLVGNTAINTNGDTEIQCSEASAYTDTIDCNNLSISDLTGIEAFTGLTSLTCNSNTLTSLNIAQNTSLTFLNCNSNQISSVNISNNTLLKQLYIDHNNITNIDLSANIALEYFGSEYNSLTSLNLSTNSALVELYCDQNSITNLDFSNNLNLKQVFCSNNNIQTINLTNNTLLEGLFIDRNYNLTTLNLGANTALIDVNCFSTAVVSLDLSNSVNLNRLYFSDNQSATSLNLANTNTSGIGSFFANNCPNLSCIQVDDTVWSNANWTVSNGRIDATTSFSTNCSSTTGVQEFKSQLEIAVFPNPTNGLVTIKSTEKISSIELYNLMGQKVEQFQNTNTINISSFPNGIYTTKVFIGTSKPTMHKLVKE